MAAEKDIVISLKINGLDIALDNAESIKTAFEKLKKLADEPMGDGIAAGLEKAGKAAFTLEQRLKAVNDKGYAKALAEGFLETAIEILNVNEALQKQAAETEKGTAAFAKNKASAEASAKQVAKITADQIKATKDVAAAEAAAAAAAEKLRAAAAAAEMAAAAAAEKAAKAAAAAEQAAAAAAEKAAKATAAAEAAAIKEIEKLRAAAAAAAEKATKENAKAAKAAIAAEAAATKEAFKNALDDKGFAGAFADGTIKSLNDIKTAFFILKAQVSKAEIGTAEASKLEAEFKNAKAALEVFGAEFEKVGADGETALSTINSSFIQVNNVTGAATLNVDALGEQYKELDKSVKVVAENTEELSREFQKLTIPQLELELNNTSLTQLEKELKGLEQLKTELQVGTAAFDEVEQKIKLVTDQLNKELEPAFLDLSTQEIRLVINKTSVAELEKQQEELTARFKTMKPTDAGYDEVILKLKLVKKGLLDVETSTEVIKDLDITQAYVDFATKTVEGLNNATAAIGSFGGATAETEQVMKNFEKGLQALAVVQSVVDGMKALAEANKGTSTSFLTTANAAKIFKIALLGTGIGAIALLVIALVQNFGGLKKVLGIVADAFSSLGDIVQPVVDSIKGAFSGGFDAILARAVDFGKNLFEIFAGPILAVGKAVGALFSGGGIGGAIDAFKQQAVKSAKAAEKVFGGLGAAIADAFNKGFDTRQALRENERKKLLLETTNAQRAASKTVLDAQLADATNSFKQKQDLSKRAAQAEQAQVNDSLRLNKERIKLIATMGANASEDQKEELRTLVIDSTGQAAELVALRKAQLQAERALMVEQQDYILSLAQLSADKELAIAERQLAVGVQLQNLAAEDEIRLIQKIAEIRASTLIKEEDNIKARATLTVEEQRRLVELANLQQTISAETSQILKDTTQRRLDEAALVRSAELAVQQTVLDGEAQRNELTIKRDTAEESSEARRLELARRNLDTFKQISDARLEAETILESARNRQIAQLEREAKIQADSLALQRETANADIERLTAKKALMVLTGEESILIENLTAQVANLDAAATNVKLGLKIDTDEINAVTSEALRQVGQQTQVDALAFIADPLTATLKNALKEGLKIDDATAQAILDSSGKLVESLTGLLDKVFEIQGEAIQQSIDEKATQIEEAQRQAEEATALLQENLTTIQDLQAQVATTRDANQQAVLAQLDSEIGKRGELEKKQKDAQVQLKKREAEKIELEKKAIEAQKAAGRVTIAIETAKAYATAATAIAAAAAASGPLAVFTVVATAAAVIGAIVSTLALIQSFSKGGVVPSAARGAKLVGPSHAAGGIPIAINGRQVVEAEGGEFILTKGVSASPQLSKIASDLNVAGGGVPLAANGALIGSGGIDSISRSQSASAQTGTLIAGLAAAFAEMPAPQVSVTDISSVTKRVNVQQDRASI